MKKRPSICSSATCCGCQEVTSLEKGCVEPGRTTGRTFTSSAVSFFWYFCDDSHLFLLLTDGSHITQSGGGGGSAALQSGATMNDPHLDSTTAERHVWAPCPRSLNSKTNVSLDVLDRKACINAANIFVYCTVLLKN